MEVRHRQCRSFRSGEWCHPFCSQAQVPPLPRRTSRALTGLAVIVPALLYFAYVFHYADNVPVVDDWHEMPSVVAALHGHFGFTLLWAQTGDTREVVGGLVFIGAGLLDHLDLRLVMLFSSLLFTGTYVLLLLLIGRYVGRPLHSLAVLLFGLVWFSLVDFENALWSYQVSWYLALFFVVAVIYLLTDKPRRLGPAIGLAVAASLSFLQGFIAWPLGLICLLWVRPRRREVVIWLGASLITTGVFFHGYSFRNTSCVTSKAQCSLTLALTHPLPTVKYFTVLLGDVLPLTSTGIESHLWVHAVEGTVLLLASLFVIVRSVNRQATESIPLPLCLAVFGLLFDIQITLGRVGTGLAQAASPNSSRYTMPNLVLMIAVAIYAWKHMRQPLFKFTVCVCAVLQIGLATPFGIAQGHSWQLDNEWHARILVNFKDVPSAEQACYFDSAVFSGWYGQALPWYRIATDNYFERVSAQLCSRIQDRGAAISAGLWNAHQLS